tara:strand:- start:331 stop:555 length:225 start_codon:yes stop_codon:yes gene_type:complete
MALLKADRDSNTPVALAVMTRTPILNSQDYIVVLKTTDGELIEWQCRAKSPCKAFMAAIELMPDHEIIKVSESR